MDDVSRTASMIVKPGGATERSDAQDDPAPEYAPDARTETDSGRPSSSKGRVSMRRGPLDLGSVAA